MFSARSTFAPLLAGARSSTSPRNTLCKLRFQLSVSVEFSSEVAARRIAASSLPLYQDDVSLFFLVRPLLFSLLARSWAFSARRASSQAHPRAREREKLARASGERVIKISFSSCIIAIYLPPSLSPRSREGLSRDGYTLHAYLRATPRTVLRLRRALYDGASLIPAGRPGERARSSSCERSVSVRRHVVTHYCTLHTPGRLIVSPRECLACRVQDESSAHRYTTYGTHTSIKFCTTVAGM